MKKIIRFDTAEWNKCSVTGKLFVVYRTAPWTHYDVVRDILSIELDRRGMVVRVETAEVIYVECPARK